MIRKGLVYALPPFALMLALSIWGWLGTAPDRKQCTCYPW